MFRIDWFLTMFTIFYMNIFKHTSLNIFNSLLTRIKKVNSNKGIQITSKKEKQNKTKEYNCSKEKGEYSYRLWSMVEYSSFNYLMICHIFILLILDQTSDDLKIYQRKLVNGNSLMWYLLTQTFLEIWLYIYG